MHRLTLVENRHDTSATRTGYAQNNASTISSHLCLNEPQPEITGFSRCIIGRELAARRLRLTRHEPCVPVNDSSSDSENTNIEADVDNERCIPVSSQVKLPWEKNEDSNQTENENGKDDHFEISPEIIVDDEDNDQEQSLENLIRWRDAKPFLERSCQDRVRKRRSDHVSDSYG